jgi:hypothetical protein
VFSVHSYGVVFGTWGRCPCTLSLYPVKLNEGIESIVSELCRANRIPNQLVLSCALFPQCRVLAEDLVQGNSQSDSQAQSSQS